MLWTDVTEGQPCRRLPDPSDPPPAYVPQLRVEEHARAVEEHARAILADMKEAGVATTPLSALSRALDVGVPEHVAVVIARSVGSP